MKISKVAVGIGGLIIAFIAIFGAILIYLGVRLLWQDDVLAQACSKEAGTNSFSNCLTAFTNDLTFWGISVAVIQAVLSTLGLVFTGWAALEAAKAGQAAKDSIDHSRREYLASFPPELNFRKLELLIFNPPDAPKIQCAVRNIGISRCKVIGIALRCEYGDGSIPLPPPLSLEMPYLDNAGQPQVLLPGQEQNFVMDADITPEAISLIDTARAYRATGNKDFDSTMQIYAGWRIRYVDDIGVERVTDGVSKYDLNMNRFVACDPDNKS
ncbi:hypothetical protein [Asticcacaulis taihuensis]|uniref:Uncharacterized protein n=1 Tax=Asticcacaulis taihuensis TaxID=260084 RepID=A0A1G4ST18_9CAUL|nr:hypothetical protein [Asticcacaulis taihuensis]SCW71439.1 hypothetical protein SAMN02927928_2838 [Asticcacaulis taihuensis]